MGREDAYHTLAEIRADNDTAGLLLNEELQVFRQFAASASYVDNALAGLSSQEIQDGRSI